MKREKSVRQELAEMEYNRWLKKMGYRKLRKSNNPENWAGAMTPPFVRKPAPLSNFIPAPTTKADFKQSVDDHKWKKNRSETRETIEEIERKKMRVAPAYNKGATQYITDGDDPKYLGRKI